MVLAVSFCLLGGSAWAGEKDPGCDSWFTQEHRCQLNYFTRVPVPCFEPISFPPACVQRDVKKSADYMLAGWYVVKKYSPLFNHLVEQTIINSAIDFYKSQEISSSQFYGALEKGQYADAVATILNDVYPGNFYKMEQHSSQFYGAVDKGQYKKALSLVVGDSLQLYLAGETPFPKTLDATSAHAQAFYADLRQHQYAAAITQAGTDMLGGKKVQSARAFSNAITTGDYRKAAFIANADVVKGVAEKSDYLLAPLAGPAIDAAQQLAENPNQIPDALQHQITYRDIIGAVKGPEANTKTEESPEPNTKTEK